MYKTCNNTAVLIDHTVLYCTISFKLINDFNKFDKKLWCELYLTEIFLYSNKYVFGKNIKTVYKIKILLLMKVV